MKVFFMSTATSLVGGAIRSLLSIIDACKKQNINCKIILKNHGPIEDELKNRNIEYIVVKSYDWMQPKAKWKGIRNLLKWKIKQVINYFAEIKMYLILKKERPDVYYLNVVYNPCGVKAAKKLSIPVIWHMREFVGIDSVNTDWFFNSEKAFRIMSYADTCVAITNAIKDYYSRYIPEEKITVIYNGLDMPTEVFLRKGNKNLYTITLSGAKKFKGHIDAIEAAKLLKERQITNFRIQFIGAFIDKDYQRFLDNMINEHGIGELIEFKEFTNDMESVFSQTDIGLICSRYEPFSRYAVEIMSRAIPLICTKSAGVYEVSHYGAYCSTYDEKNYEVLADTIQDILINYDKYAKKAFNISKIVLKEYSITKTTDNVIKLLRDTAK